MIEYTIYYVIKYTTCYNIRYKIYYTIISELYFFFSNFSSINRVKNIAAFNVIYSVEQSTVDLIYFINFIFVLNIYTFTFFINYPHCNW